MYKSSALSISAVIIILIVFLPLLTVVEGAPGDPSESQDSLFHDGTLRYIYQRSISFSSEVYLYESYLVWLYGGINQELKKRRKEDLNGTLEIFELLDESSLNDSLYVGKPDFDKVTHKEAYLEWERLQREKFRAKYATVRHIKDKLIRSANAKQKKRMFQLDLKSALESYRSKDYHLAILRFNETIDRYGYQDLSDIIFYRAESFFAQTLYDRAKVDYLQVVDQSDDTETKRNSFQRLLSIVGESGDLSSLKRYWQSYTEFSGDARDDHYWMTLDLYAHFLMGSSEWELARESFDLFTEESGYFAKSRLRAGDCSLSLMDLVDAESRFALFRSEQIKSRDFRREMAQEALLKLGYIEYLRGNYFDAYAMLVEVEGDGQLSEKAAILSAWSVFKVHDYEKVVEICTSFINSYPETEYFYEAYCLLGYSEEVLGRQDSALTDYRIVMGAVDDRRAYQVLNYERRNISKSLGELSALEPSLFGDEKDDNFIRYKNLRDRLTRLMYQIRLAEGTKSSTEVLEIIDELKSLHQVYLELQTLEKEIVDAEDARLIRSFGLVTNKINKLAADLNAAINYELHQQTLIQREEEFQFNDRFGDSLSVQYNKEWDSNENSLAKVRGLITDAEMAGEDDILKELSEIELSLLNQQQQLLLVKRHLHSLGGTEVSSNLDWWSWFAFQRHSTSGLAFDHLYVREQRQVELDQYIERINSILAERRAGIVEEVDLAENLELASVAGEPAYVAPPVPMWKPEITDVDTSVSDTEETEAGEDAESDSLESDVSDMEILEGEEDVEEGLSIDEESLGETEDDLIDDTNDEESQDSESMDGTNGDTPQETTDDSAEIEGGEAETQTDDIEEQIDDDTPPEGDLVPEEEFESGELAPEGSAEQTSEQDQSQQDEPVNEEPLLEYDEEVVEEPAEENAESPEGDDQPEAQPEPENAPSGDEPVQDEPVDDGSGTTNQQDGQLHR